MPEETTVIENREEETAETIIPTTEIESQIDISYQGYSEDFFTCENWLSLQNDIHAMRQNSDLFLNALPVYTAIILIYLFCMWFYKTFIK